MKILVIQQKMIGDVLISSVICENLKRNFPTAEVHYLINRFTFPVVENHKHIDKFVFFEDEYKNHKLKFLDFLNNLKSEAYTHVFDAYGKLESNLITYFTGAQFKFSYNKWYTNWLYTKTFKESSIAKTEAGSAIENRLKLLQLLPEVEIINPKPKIYLSSTEVNTARSQIDSAELRNTNLIMVSALGSGDAKTYPLKYMAVLLNEITEKTDAHLILNYMPSQQEKINRLLEHCSNLTRTRIVNDLRPESLREFMAICSQCNLIFGNEGGAINIAKALDVPSFAIFSPWIIKEGWNSFEESYPNTSVHLSDFKPSKLRDKKVKELKMNYEKLYQDLNPQLFNQQLIDFVCSHVS
ncbi:glycosyltransferase family 9 protein [Psychroflexus sp. ALD_RP9]|uniref:glycosyltransferase family 9 protein n=1 Tax=Psychroflexus sp. ALD_RP9 TaxID=2777186 RepID=UPI001A8CD560|nr:glycosyltransferase family 9 protein [Psychroflexus sp. ALD_RP9]QSS96846.1 glycosyltransferase family 9 protein [Psychroflexus sp. ALD_RP9]